jgi:ABC-2 type transport system ATP-binding protein
VDSESDEPTASPRGSSGRAPAARGSAARRPSSGRAGAAKTGTATPGAAKAGAAKAGAAKKEPGSASSGPTRSVARRGSIGAGASTAAAVAAEPDDQVDVQPVALVVVEPAPVAEPVLEPEPVAAPEPLVEQEQEHELAPRRPVAPPASADAALAIRGLRKAFGPTVAVDDVDLDVRSGSFFGFVGPNGAGKTTTLSMITGLLRPDAGTVSVHGADMWTDPRTAKRALGVLPDRLRLFDRLTGVEYLHHAGALRGLDRATIVRRTSDLIHAFGLESAADRFVSDFSAGMVKKIAIAAAMIHSPRLLVLDEPFESVDPVSAQLVIDVLASFTRAGGTVVLSSHSMDLIERVCDSVAIIADGRMLASGPLADVLDGVSLEDRFVELAGGATAVEGMEWLQSFSD